MSAPAASESLPICLIGLRCSGKTTVGRALAQHLSRPFLDLDQALAERWSRELEAEGLEGGSAGELLGRFGEAEFRVREEASLAQWLEAREGHVIATGGGCVESAVSRERLERGARVIWLRVPLAELARRVRADPTPRPPLLAPELTGDDSLSGPEAAAAELPHLARRRDPWYRALAHSKLDCGTRSAPEIAVQLAGDLARGTAQKHERRSESDTKEPHAADSGERELGPESDPSR